ncbi:hypothetical protein [Enterococcus faecalis]|uniref:hypothetical protein n=1 Tax=Enterococcus faecalis TaxID=1351 RepID=UPI00201A199B|nr:hypothetical protein [Enterococcus faecalis]UQQ68481.1 hypothetical protein LQ055_03155 [Enterococcus faecalis]
MAHYRMYVLNIYALYILVIIHIISKKERMVLNKFVWGIFSCIISWLFLSLTQPLIAHSETLNPTTHASTFSETFTSVSTEQQTTQATDIVEQETEQTHASSENDEPMAPTPASVSVGNSTLKSTLSTGTYNQDIITLSYEYSVTLIGLAINDRPIIAIQLPTEISSQLDNDTLKQQDFLTLLTGTVSYPGTATQDIHSSTNGVSLSYSSTYHSVYLTFPSSTLVLLPGTKWSAAISFDVGALYKRGISIPPALNGKDYPIRGTFTDVGTGLGAINIIIGNNTKTGVISKAQLSLGNYPVPQVTPAKLTQPNHLDTTVTGTIQQVQDPNYNYSVQLTLNRHDGTTTPIVVKGISVDAAGNFSTSLASPLEYGDTLSTIVFARSKTSTDYIQSSPSADQSVNWSIQPVTNVVANAGSTQLSGKASQVSNGTYQVKVQINGGSIYTTSLDSNGHFQFANLPTFQGGETVSLWVQGLSNRTGLPLLTSSTVSQTVAYSVPQLTVTQIIERKNAQRLWEAANSVVSGQIIRFTLTTRLTNQPATWMNQQLRATVPKGLSQLSAATLTKQSAAGLSTPIAGLQLLTDSSTGLPYWSYHNSLPADNFTEANTQFTLQYTATVTEEWINQFLLFSSTVTGNDGGGTPITPITKEQSLPIKNGTLRFVQMPTTVSFKNLPFPSKRTLYSPSTISAPFLIADGRVAKTPWHLLVRESQPMHSTSTNKTIQQAFIYRKNGSDFPISSLATEVYQYTATDDNNVEIPWNQQNGLFLSVAPDLNLTVKESYTAELQWILSDTPL